MVVLGINGGFRQGYQDVSACLVIDGELIAAIEEERLNRIKFSPGRLPYKAILEVLKIGAVSIKDVDCVAFHGETWGDLIDIKIKAYFNQHFGYSPALKKFHHHNCHAAASFYSSEFKRALILTMDNSGDGISTQIALGENGKINPIKRYGRPQSFGVFYSLITQYCGFKKDSDEYKLMGLAAYGDKNRFDFSWLMDFTDGEFHLDTNYIVTVEALQPSLHQDEMNFNENFVARLGQARRLPAEPLSQFYKDVAASAQQQLEKTVLKLLQFYVEKYALKNVCTAGGVALNCLMNQKIMNAPFIENLYVQPASSDAGISLGAAWLAAESMGDIPTLTESLFLGNLYGNDEIKKLLDTCQVKYERIENPAQEAASLIAQNKVIGWFQGRMEFGPRALGNRSILANPAAPDIQAVVNNKIKFRDSFRPFGASVIEEYADEYFDDKSHVRNYMTINVLAKPAYKKTLAGVTHHDGTCRIHKVNEVHNELYYSLLCHLKQKTGVGVVLNTSFNLNHEPIVCTPQEALATFYGSGLDGLIIGNFLIKK